MTTELLVASSICKRFGGVVAVDDVSISIAPLEIKCIIGANGAGKSTLFNILCGSMAQTSGSITFEGREISGLPLHKFARIGIARKFQIPSVFDSLTLSQNLMAAVVHPQSRPVLMDRVDAMLSRVSLAGERDKLAGNLAHGQKQWLEMGMALMAAPKLLLLDEPTAGMTPEETLRTAELVRSFSNDMAVIAIEHDMSFVRALGCHTYVMHQGRLIVEGGFSRIEKNKLVRDVYLGRA